MDTTVRMPRCIGFLIGLAIILWGVGCSHSPRKVVDHTPIPSMAPEDALIDSCENIPESQDVRCPLDVFLKSIDNFGDLWDFSRKCEARLKACQRFGAVDRAEMQGQINEQAARADKYQKQRWWFLGGGIVGGVVLTVLAALAF